MFFISSENRRRHKSIERAMEHFETLLSRSDAEEGLISLPESKMYRHTLDDLVIPNVKDGVIKLGRQALSNQDFIPVFVAKPGETIIIPADLSTPTPVQCAKINEFLSDKQMSVALEGASSSCTMSDYGPAFVSTSTFIAENTTIHMRGRPALFLNYSQPPAFNPATIAHELIHIRQQLLNPIFTLKNKGEHQDKRLEDELEAHAFESKVHQEAKRQQRINEYGEARLKFINIIFSIVDRYQNEQDAPGTINENTRSVFRELGIKLIKEDLLSEEDRKLPIF